MHNVKNATAIDRIVIEQTAAVLGASSAAAKALAEADRLIAEGREVSFLKTGSTILVKSWEATPPQRAE